MERNKVIQFSPIEPFSSIVEGIYWLVGGTLVKTKALNVQSLQLQSFRSKKKELVLFLKQFKPTLSMYYEMMPYLRLAYVVSARAKIKEIE